LHRGWTFTPDRINGDQRGVKNEGEGGDGVNYREAQRKSVGEERKGGPYWSNATGEGRFQRLGKRRGEKKDSGKEGRGTVVKGTAGRET